MPFKEPKNFDEDDPLAGLLPDDDDYDVVPKSKGPAVAPGRTVNRTTAEKDDALSTSLLPESPPRRRNILDDLLAKSDIAKTADEPPKLDFVLGEQYRSSKTSQDEDTHFGSYMPTGSQRANLEPRRPATGASSASDDDILSFLTDGTAATKGPKPKQMGRRGISPTLEPPKTADPSGGQQQPLAAQPLPRSRSTDWLELKNDSQPSKAPEKPPSSPRRRGAEPTGERKPPKATASTDWLGTEEQPQPKVQNQNATDVPTVPPKSDNFLDWLGSKTAKKQEEPQQNLSSQTMIAASGAIHPSEQPQAKGTLPTTSVDTYSIVPAEYEGRLSMMRTQMADLHTKFSEESLASAATILDLQTKVHRLQFERDQLNSAFEGLEGRHKEELAALEASFKKRTSLIEESYQRREKRLQEELESVSQDQIGKHKAWENERSELVANWQRRVDEATQDRMEDLEKIKDLHRNTIVDMKKDHELAIARLQQIKKIEVDAMTEAQSHSKTLHDVIEQLRSNTTELGQLQFRVEGGHQAGVEERMLLLETKDRQLTLLQEQLKKQRDENEQERLNLRQLITRLEDKLHQQTLSLEEERWKIAQDRNLLEVEKTTAEELKKLTTEKLEKERLMLEKSKSAFLEEQKLVMQQMYNQKAQLYSTTTERGLSDRTLQQVEVPNSFQDLQVQAEFESTLKSIESERRRFEAGKRKLAEDAERLERERQILDNQQSELEDEKAAISALAVQVKQRSEEVEEMGLAAAQTREEGFAALQEANVIKTEMLSRQEGLKTQFEALKAKERHLAEERLRLAQMRKELEHLQSKLLCIRCQTPITGGLFLESRIPSFAAWKMAAEKDKEFLQRESRFLESLRSPTQGDSISSVRI